MKSRFKGALHPIYFFIKWYLWGCNCLCYLSALSMEVLELVDTHLSITVSYQDTVCLCREQHFLHVHCGGSMLYYNWVQAEDNTEDPQTQLVWVKQKNQPTRHKSTHMFKLRSQISSCLSLTTPNMPACLGDHLMSCTAPWMQMNVNRGRRWLCFHSWTVQSEEQLRNTSGLNGDQVTTFTAHWGWQSKFSANNVNKYSIYCIIWLPISQMFEL